MAAQDVTARLLTLLEPPVALLGCELIDIEHSGQTLRVYIDKAGGVTVDDCERVSHQISGVLDVEDPIAGRYTLEVSSPGLDRPLNKPEHFQRFAGHEVKVRLTVPLAGRRNFKGELRGVRGDAVVVALDEGQEVALPLHDIEKARLVPDI